MGRKGFTLMELVVTITLMGIIVVPLAIMGVELTRSNVVSGQILQAANLGRLEMARVNDLSFNDPGLADGYNNTSARYEGYNYDVKRTVAYVPGTGNNLKKVEVMVCPAGSASPLTLLAACVADIGFGAGSGGAAPGYGNQTDSFTLTGGQIAGGQLKNFTIANSGSSAITITAVTVAWTGASGISFTTVTFNNTTCWSGARSPSPAAVTLTTAFTIPAGTSYGSKNELSFSKNLAFVSVTFTFADGSTSRTYSFL